MKGRDFRPTPDPKDLDTWDMIWFMEVQKKKRKKEEAKQKEKRRRRSESGEGMSQLRGRAPGTTNIAFRARPQNHVIEPLDLTLW